MHKKNDFKKISKQPRVLIVRKTTTDLQVENNCVILVKWPFPFSTESDFSRSNQKNCPRKEKEVKRQPVWQQPIIILF